MTVPASRDIESIIDFIAGNSGFDAAEHFLNKINVKCKILANFPNLGRRRDELNPSLRIFSVDDYLIFYCPVEEGIEIGFRVVPSYRKVSSRLQRLYPYVFLADKHTFSMYFWRC